MADKPPAHEIQALNELATGSDEQRRAAEKRLAAAGHRRAKKDDTRDVAEDVAERAPQGRRAPSKQHG